MNELEPRMRELLNAAREADEPTAAERAMNRAHLGRRLALLGVTVSALAQGTSAAAATVAATEISTGALAKLIVVWVSLGVLASGAVGGVVLAARPNRPPVVAATQSSTPAQALARGRAGTKQSAETAAIPAASAETPTLTYSGAAAPKRHDTDAARRADAARVLTPPATAEEVSSGEQPDIQGVGPAAPSASARASELNLALAVLTRAQQQLSGGQPTQALSTLDQYAMSMPRGPMGEEREALRIIALCRLAPSRGLAEAERFLQRAPSSPLSTRVRAACRL